MDVQKYEKIGEDVKFDSGAKVLPVLPTHIRFKEVLRRSGRRLVFAWWAWEIWAAVLSTLATIILLVVLAQADKQPTRTWSVGSSQLTLNAVIAAIGTVQRAALLLAVGGALNQHMWNWFARRKSAEDTEPRSNRLKDLGVFSEGASNIWRCLNILWRTKGRYLVSLGALVTIQALFFDVFLQQVVQVYQQTERNALPSSNSSTENALPQVFAFDLDGGNGANNDFGDRQTPVLLQSLVMAGLVQDNVLPPGAICPTGECTWPETPSLAISSQCKALNASKTISSNSTCERIVTYTLNANDIELDMYDETSIHMSYTSCQGEHSTFWANDLTGPRLHNRGLFNVLSWGTNYVGATPGGPHASGQQMASIDDYPFAAYFCQFYYSVKLYAATLSQGKMSYSTPKEVFSEIDSAPDPGPGLHISYTYPMDDSTAAPSIYNVGAGAKTMLSAAFVNLLAEVPDVYREGTGATLWETEVQTYWLWEITGSLSNISTHMEGVADSLTHWMRTNHASTKLPDAQYLPIVTTQVPTVAVRWIWLTYPLGLQICGLLFLALTMRITLSYDVRPWKGDRIPLLLARFDDSIHKRALGGLANRTGLDDRLGEMRIRMDYDGEDGILFRGVDEKV